MLWATPERKIKNEGQVMTAESMYTPRKVWEWNQPSGGRFANINRPIAGATHEKDLPVGEHALQLYSLATHNGVTVTVLLEEFLEDLVLHPPGFLLLDQGFLLPDQCRKVLWFLSKL